MLEAAGFAFSTEDWIIRSVTAFAFLLHHNHYCKEYLHFSWYLRASLVSESPAQPLSQDRSHRARVLQQEGKLLHFCWFHTSVYIGCHAGQCIDCVGYSLCAFPDRVWQCGVHRASSEPARTQAIPRGLPEVELEGFGTFFGSIFW